MDNKLIVGVVVSAIAVAIVIGGASFYGGIKYEQMSRGERFGAGQNFQGPPGSARAGAVRFGQGNATVGKILSKDETGITVELTQPGIGSKTQETGSKVILVSDATQISKTASGSANDLVIGETVVIQGSQNTDGSITAQSIQIRPMSINMPGIQ